MFGFPPILDGNAGIKFTNNADSGFPKLGIREIFYSVRDGNWTDANVWQTASGRVGLLPSVNDDVYVRHVVSIPGVSINTSLNTLYVFNRLNFNAFNTLNTVNTISTGIIDMTSSNSSLGISGNNSTINNLLIGGSGSGINYNGTGNQTILPLTYQNLTISNRGVKSLIADLVVNGNLSTSAPNIAGGTTTNDTSGLQNAILDLGAYALTVNGTTTIGGNSYLRKYNSEGNLLFVGLLTFAGSGNQFGLPDFQGNINVELRGGLTNTGAGSGLGAVWNTGIGNWRFTTNNQTVTHNAGFISYDNTFEIEDGRTITVSGNNVWVLKNTINGLGATARLTMGASSTLNYQNATQPMSTGILDTSTNLNTFIYGSGAQNIKGGPSLVAKQVYRNLTLNGGGVKTLQGYVSVQNTYTLTPPATLALNGFTLTNP